MDNNKTKFIYNSELSSYVPVSSVGVITSSYNGKY